MAWFGTWAKRIEIDIDYTDGIGGCVYCKQLIIVGFSQ